MHKSATKCNETSGKWCKNKNGASKIIDTLETYQGTSPSRQGAGTETSVPQNLASTAAALRNCSGNFADSFRVFRPEALYRRRGVVRSGPRPPHT
jgi:hypothetical protein